MTISQLIIANAAPAAAAFGGLIYLTKRGAKLGPPVRTQRILATPPVDRRLLIRRTMTGQGRAVTRDWQ